MVQTAIQPDLVIPGVVILWDASFHVYDTEAWAGDHLLASRKLLSLDN